MRAKAVDVRERDHLLVAVLKIITHVKTITLKSSNSPWSIPPSGLSLSKFCAADAPLSPPPPPSFPFIFNSIFARLKTSGRVLKICFLNRGPEGSQIPSHKPFRNLYQIFGRHKSVPYVYVPCQDLIFPTRELLSLPWSTLTSLFENWKTYLDQKWQV